MILFIRRQIVVEMSWSYALQFNMFVFLTPRNTSKQFLAEKIVFFIISAISEAPPLIRVPLLQWKSEHIRGVTSFDGNNVVVFYYLSALAFGLITEVAFDESGFIVYYFFTLKHCQWKY